MLFRAFLLFAIAYVVWDRVEAFRLSRTIAAIAARGEPVRYADAFPMPRTDEQRQASSLYAQAASFAREQAAEDNNRAGRLDVDKPVGSELSLPDMIAFYRPDASAMQVLTRPRRSISAASTRPIRGRASTSCRSSRRRLSCAPTSPPRKTMGRVRRPRWWPPCDCSAR